MWKPASLALASAVCLGLLTPATAHHDGAHASAAPVAVTSTGKVGMSHGEMAKAKVGDIMVMNAMIRATPPAAPAAGGFVTLHNMGATDDTLIAARVGADIAGKVELHTMEMDGDVMRMREVDGYDIRAGEPFRLNSGGDHLMIFGLAEGALDDGEMAVTLEFEDGANVDAVLPASVTQPG